MKEHWSFSKEKLVAAEEGLKSVESVTEKSICNCNSLIQYAKLVLYIELILFLGWSSYTLWQAYDQQAEIRFFNVFYPNALQHAESSIVTTEVPKSLQLKDFENTVEKTKAKKDSSIEEYVFSTEISPIDDQLDVENANKEKHFDDNFIWHRYETITESGRLKDSLESSKSDENKEIITEQPSLDGSDFNETETSENGSIIEWGFPILGHIHQEIDPFTNNSAFDTFLEHLFKNDKEDESINDSEVPQMSSEKESEQQNEKEDSSVDCEEVPSSAEIIDNLNKLYKSIEAAKNNLHLKFLDLDDFSESLENSKTDETSETTEEDLHLGIPDLVDVSKSLENSKTVETSETTEEDLHSAILDLVDNSESSENSKTEKSFETTEEFLYWRFGDLEDDSLRLKYSKLKNGREEDLHSGISDLVDDSKRLENSETDETSETTEEDLHLGIPDLVDVSKSLENSKTDETSETTEEDLHLGISDLVDVSKSLEHSKTDEMFDTSDSSNPVPFKWSRWDMLKEPSYWRESTESSIALPTRWDKEESYVPLMIHESDSDVDQKPFWRPFESNEFDTSEARDTTSDWMFNYWGRQALTEPTITLRTWNEDPLISDEFTENNMHKEVTTTPTDEEDNDSVMERENGNFRGWETWEPFPNMYHDFSKSSGMESVESEKETIQFDYDDSHHRIENDDSTNRDPCTIEVFNGIRVMKCSWNSDYSDRSSDLSDTTESKKDSSEEHKILSLFKRYQAFSKKYSDTFDSSVIDNIEKRSSKSSEDSSVTTETSNFENSDKPTSSKNSVLSRHSYYSPPFSTGQIGIGFAKTTLNHEGAYVSKMNDETRVQDWLYKREIREKTIRRYAKKDLDEIMTKFYSKMETISAHIDALHEQYLRRHKLEDDYISQELPNENYMKIKNNIANVTV